MLKFIMGLLISLWLVGSCYAGSVSVMVNADVPDTRMSRDEITAIFTFKSSQWSDSMAIQVVLMPLNSQGMRDFLEDYTGYRPLGYSRFYKNGTSTGRERPAIVVDTYDKMLTTVSNRSSAIGFMEKAMVNMLKDYGIKVVEIR